MQRTNDLHLVMVKCPRILFSRIILWHTNIDSTNVEGKEGAKQKNNSKKNYFLHNWANSNQNSLHSKNFKPTYHRVWLIAFLKSNQNKPFWFRTKSAFRFIIYTWLYLFLLLNSKLLWILFNMGSNCITEDITIF